ncbi:MAG: hypothetical protein JW839_16765 [Candidatus Lokiarchaeota archaeon]|nr:hypothetical protein [Candidatus Lokiarchaeota archaeon]
MMGISDCDLISAGQGCLAMNGQPAALEQLFVIHRTSSILLFTHHFKECDVHHRDVDDLNGAAIGMMDNLLGEILSSRLHIKQIIHDERVLLFQHGMHCCFILVANGLVNEAKVHLERFEADFETRFAAKMAGNFNCDMNEYEQALSLVKQNLIT